MFEMEDKLNDTIDSYSHGMKQKIVLISALAHDPKILIMDEPFVGLDPKAVFDIKEILKSNIYKSARSRCIKKHGSRRYAKTVL